MMIRIVNFVFVFFLFGSLHLIKKYFWNLLLSVLYSSSPWHSFIHCSFLFQIIVHFNLLFEFDMKKLLFCSVSKFYIKITFYLNLWILTVNEPSNWSDACELSELKQQQRNSNIQSNFQKHAEMQLFDAFDPQT